MKLATPKVRKKTDAGETEGPKTAVDSLNHESFELRHLDQKKSEELARQALLLAERINDEKGSGHAQLNIGFQELSLSQYQTKHSAPLIRPCKFFED